MIFDDHEVTDDWYLSQSWRSRVLTAPFGRADRPQRLRRLHGVPGLGQRPVGVHPHGAEPEAEERGAARHARRGRRPTAPFGAAHDREARAAARPHEAGDRPRGRASTTRCPGRATWCACSTPARAAPTGGGSGPPKLLGNSLDAQLPAGPLTDGRELLVVISPVPILMPHAIEALVQPLAAGIIDFMSNAKRKAEADHDGPPVSGPERFDVEGWGGDEETFDAHRAAGSPPTRAASMLSGDVHFASGIALDFWPGQDPTVDARRSCSSRRRRCATAPPEDIRAAIFAARFSQQLLRGRAHRAPRLVREGGDRRCRRARRSRPPAAAG